MVEGELKRHPMAACSTLSTLVTVEGREDPAGCCVLKMSGNSLLGGWDETSVQTAHTDLNSRLRKCLKCGAMIEESILQFKARLDPPAAVDSLPVRVTPTVRVARCGTCWHTVEMGGEKKFFHIGLKHDGADPTPEVVLDGEIDAVVNGKRRFRGGKRVFDQQLQRPARRRPRLEQSNAAAPDQCIECQGASSRFFGDIEAALHNGKASLEVCPAEGEPEALSQYEQAERITHALRMLRDRLAEAELQGHTHCEPRHGGSWARSVAELSRERARSVNGFVRAFFREELAKMKAIEDHSLEGSDGRWELRSWVGGAQTAVVCKALGHGCSLQKRTVLAVGRSESAEPGQKRWGVLGPQSPKIDIEGEEFEEGGPAAGDERAEETGTPVEAFVEPA